MTNTIINIGNQKKEIREDENQINDIVRIPVCHVVSLVMGLNDYMRRAQPFYTWRTLLIQTLLLWEAKAESKMPTPLIFFSCVTVRIRVILCQKAYQKCFMIHFT